MVRAKAIPARKKKKSQPGWIAWWPAIAGIAAAPLAVKTAEILPLTGPSGLTELMLLFPFALLLKQQAIGLPDWARSTLPQILLWAQFPLYGLYVTLVMRWKPFLAALSQLAAIHLIGFAALWLLARR